MSKPNLEDKFIKQMVLEDEILDDLLASQRVCKEHWMSQYFKRRYEEKIERWEKLTGRQYGNKDI